jgi:hypothetical protein
MFSASSFRRTLRAIAILGASSLVAVAPVALKSSPASAATITVTSLTDVTDGSDGVTTLREAVAASAMGDTITFDSSLFSGTRRYLDLTSTISIPSSRTIVGPGQNLLTIRGTVVSGTMASYSRTSNVVTVTMSATPQFTSTIVFIYGSSAFGMGAKNVTSTSGNSFTFADNGSDIGTTSTTGTVVGTVGTPYRAFVFSGTLNISDLTIDKFMSNRGGAFAQGGQGARLIAERVTFSNNVGYDGYCGGAINANRGWVTATDSTFNANIANCGSAIQMGDGSGTTLTITGSTFTNNISGNATVWSGLPMTFVNSSMSGSKNLTNGEMTGVYMGSFGMPFTMTGSTVSDPVVIENNSRVIITGSTLSSVSITHALAKIQNNNITSCTVSDTTAVDVSSGNTIGNASGCSVESGVGAKIISYSRASNVLTLTTATAHGLAVGDTVRQCGIQALAPVVWSWCHLTGTVLSVTSTTVTFADQRSDVGTTQVYSNELDRAAYVFSNVPYVLPQSVTWSPTTSLTVGDSPRSPSTLATTSGNGAITYSVTSAGATGCSVGSSTGVLTFSSAGSCTIRASAAATSQWGAGTKSVTFVITASSSSSSSSSSTTSTTTPSSSAPASSVVTTAPSSGGQSSVSTIAPGGTSSTVPTPLAVASSGASASLPSSSTSVPSLTTTIPAPKAPELKVGESSALVDGKAVSTSLSRSENKITAKAAGVAATIWGLDKDGRTVALDIDGNVRLNIGDKVVVQASGFAAGEDVSVWLFSVPSRLGVIAADDSGKVEGTFDLPKNVEMGDHRLVFDGTRSDGKPVTLGFGVAIGKLETSSSLSRVLIAIPVLIAIFIGFFIPAVTRRRRKELTA